MSKSNWFGRHALSLTLGASILAATAALAVPVQGSADDLVFYAAPTALSGAAGDLLSYRTASVKLGTGAPAVSAWNVIYQSKTAHTVSGGVEVAPKDNAVSGTVLVPTKAWTGGGSRPVMIYAIGTHGLATSCAPSRQMAAGTDYESGNIAAALNAGYAVLVTDYAGYLNDQKAIYMAGESQAHAALDIFRAATALPGAGIDPKAKVGVWGYSQGGQTAAKVAEIASTYAPDINIVGVATGGVPAELRSVARNLDGNTGAAFLMSTVAGLANEYGKRVPISIIATTAGKAELAKLSGECVFEALLDLQNRTLGSLTVGNQALDDLLDVVSDVLDEQQLGKQTPTMPIYHYHGQADEFIPLAQAFNLKKQYCAGGAKVKFDAYPSEHLVTMVQSAPKVLAWMSDRLAGKAAPNTCSNTTQPAVTALPGGGDYKVALDHWPLDAKVVLKTLQQTVTLPSTSSLTAVANLTNPNLTGQMSIPAFRQSIKILGLSVPVGMRVTPVGDATGTAALDKAGVLSITATAKADITVTSILGLPIGECKTATPVNFALSSSGSVSGLGSGLTFTGTTSFPALKGCLVSAVLTALMSGPGQAYSFTVAPPEPLTN
ncbi:lipase family protein [Aquabacterium sp.]|uniref:lipase family protein n=1 Tax=Aquabacterium sp. TaxID=1872578 RepID=UPI0035B32437